MSFEKLRELHVDERCTSCDRCGETIWLNDAEQDNDTTLCSNCFNSHYRRCECCGRIIHDDDVNWHNDYPYCDNCFDEFDEEIKEYNYKPEPVFYGKGKLFMGVELEVDEGGKSDNNARTLKDIANARHQHIYIKSDGSIEDGFEIDGFEKTAEEILKKAKDDCISRYVAVNLKNYYTIEFRLFRGTLKYNTFIATLQMVQKICNVAISMSQNEIENLSWSEFVTEIEYPKLIQYLKERRLYVNEKISVESVLRRICDMCAIFGFLDYGKKISASKLKKLINALAVNAEVRGTDATGISYVKKW